MIHWYSQNDPDDRNEDSLGLDQADHKDDDDEEEEQEDLAIIMVTHGAGSNALIGAITEQPVLLDVGMASLTMAVRREDAPPADSTPDYINSPTEATPVQSPRADGPVNRDAARRGSFGTGLSAVYEMKIIASTEHLRPGTDPARASPSPFSTRSGLSGDAASRGSKNGSVMSSWSFNDDHERPKSQSSSLGSIRRPGNANSAAPVGAQGGGLSRRATQPNAGLGHAPAPTLSGASTPASAGGGLWTPPSGRTPLLDAQRVADDKKNQLFSLSGGTDGTSTPGDDMVLDFSNSPPDSRPGSSGGQRSKSKPQVPVLALDGAVDHPSISASHDNDEARSPLSSNKPRQFSNDSRNNEAAGAPLAPIPSAESERDAVPELPSKQNGPPPVASIPDSLSRKLSQKGLWGSKPSGDEVKRNWAKGQSKRRWTVSDQDGNG